MGNIVSRDVVMLVSFSITPTFTHLMIYRDYYKKTVQNLLINT